MHAHEIARTRATASMERVFASLDGLAVHALIEPVPLTATCTDAVWMASAAAFLHSRASFVRSSSALRCAPAMVLATTSVANVMRAGLAQIARSLTVLRVVCMECATMERAFAKPVSLVLIAATANVPTIAVPMEHA